MPPANGPKKPATVIMMRMKRRRHSKKAEYGGGGPPGPFSGSVPFSGSGCAGGVGVLVESIGCLTALVSACSRLTFSDSFSKSGLLGIFICAGGSACDTKGVRSVSAMVGISGRWVDACTCTGQGTSVGSAVHVRVRETPLAVQPAANKLGSVGSCSDPVWHQRPQIRGQRPRD